MSSVLPSAAADVVARAQPRSGHRHRRGWRAGTLVAIHLLRELRASGTAADVVLVDPAESKRRRLRHPGRASPAQCCSGSDGRCPTIEHLLRWARCQPDAALRDATTDDFLPRRSYGAYLRDTLDQEIARSGTPPAASPGARGDPRAGLGSGPAPHHASRWPTAPRSSSTVVLAAASSPRAPAGSRPLYSPPTSSSPSWARARSRDRRRRRRAPRRHRTDHGRRRVDLGHRRSRACGLPPRPAAQGPRSAPTACGRADRAARRPRHHAAPGRARPRAHHGRTHGDWRPAMDGMQPRTARLWSMLPRRYRREFLRTTHCCGTPPYRTPRHRRVDHRGCGPVARSSPLHGSSRSRTLGCAPRQLSDGVPAGRPRRQLHGATVDVSLSRDPLLTGLLASGHASAGPLGMGLAADAEGRVRAADGAVGAVWTLGALRRGGLWESAPFGDPVASRRHAHAIDPITASPPSRRPLPFVDSDTPLRRHIW
jgi:hypothetical protein